MLTIDDARANHFKTDWDNLQIHVPWFVGRRIVDPSVDDLIPFIDWTVFFASRGLPGGFPEILDHPQYGAVARELYDQAEGMLDRIAGEKLLTPRGVYGFWPANSVGDDIVVYKDDARARELVRFHLLRQQKAQPDGGPNLSLSDFIAPKDSFAPDYLGAFAVTAGPGSNALSNEYRERGDDRSAGISEGVVGRLAEAFAEQLHLQARKDWGYAANETLSNEELIGEQYRGIRPVFGYPACPDISERVALVRLLHAAEIGITLTTALAMAPDPSVCGLYVSHPDARYFDIGPIGSDQLEDYALRQGVTVEQASASLAQHFGN